MKLIDMFTPEEIRAVLDLRGGQYAEGGAQAVDHRIDVLGERMQPLHDVLEQLVVEKQLENIDATRIMVAWMVLEDVLMLREEKKRVN